jgi:hypothetical protein
LDIIGSKQERQRFARKALNAQNHSVLIDFEQFVPMPNEVRESDNTRDWRINHWGTKWNLSDDTIEVHNTDDFTMYHFMTAWTPPNPVALAMSRQFPTLNFHLRYWESGAAFQGEFQALNGVALKHETSPYHGNRGG